MSTPVKKTPAVKKAAPVVAKKPTPAAVKKTPVENAPSVKRIASADIRKDGRPRARRMLPEERLQKIDVAILKVAASEQGLPSLSRRTVGIAADIAQGTVAHYYKGPDALVSRAAALAISSKDWPLLKRMIEDGLPAKFVPDSAHRHLK